MASKESEGIKLLSVYDDEEDEEMDDVKDGGNLHLEWEEGEKGPLQTDDDYMETSDKEDEIRVGTDRETVASDSGNDRTPQLSVDKHDNSLHQRQEVAVAESKRQVWEKLTIVDYGHDEVAMSPEAEEGGVESSSEVRIGGRFQTVTGKYQEKMIETVQVFSPNIGATPNSSEIQGQVQLDTPNQDYMESDASETKHNVEATHDIDTLDKFLPPPSTITCSIELQERIRKFIAYKRAGKSFNAEVRNRKDYRNPDFLLHAVRYQDIDQIGSCFSKDVFDPHGYDPSDYYDEIEVAMKREAERKELERKKSQQVEFVSGVAQVANLAAASKISLPVTVANVAAGAVRSALTAPDSTLREARQNKKSKWDKVDTGDQDTTSTIGAHAAPLSAVSAGVGYTAFAQQRRREVEEKRSGENKS
ncbi:hypothetical protein SAY86_028478 [Trapa natans]|uniref:SAP30-binding protein n=1 Tax=Trapa natans TaxID=22666 RepID=A0AAN7M190_TRANT|nr:hypothetical protein SAY86_028478 [Trapa natans]